MKRSLGVQFTAADMLVELAEEMNANSFQLIFAELKDSVREKTE